MFQKIRHVPQLALKHFFLFVKDDEIIRISNVILYLESMLHKLIKFIHINIHQKLRGEIAERQPLAWRSTLKTIDHSFDQPDNIRVGNILF